MSTLFLGQGLVDQPQSLSVCGLRLSVLDHRRYNLSRHPHFLTDLVSSHLVCNQPKTGRERFGVATSFGFGQLPNRLGLAAQVEAGDGAAGTGSAFWPN